MTDAAPRIFRNLESQAGRESFDTIVLAAVAGFAALARPSASQARDFGRLVEPLFERTSAETRRVVAASLSVSPRLPRELVILLVAQPLDVSAPFLLSSPTLTTEDLATLSERDEDSLRKLLEAREGGSPFAGAERSGDDEATAREEPPAAAETPPVPAVADASASAPRLSASRQTELLSAGSPTPDEPRLNISETREKLRGLVRLADGDHATPKPEPDLFALAVARNEEPFYLELASKLFLDRAQLAEIERDASGGRLAVALKAIGFDVADAMTILMMVKPAIGTDVDAFEAMRRSYETLSPQEYANGFKRGRAVHDSLYVETASPVRAEPRRATFGRRDPARVRRRDTA